MSHIGVGVALVVALCTVWFLLVGEYPYRLHTWVIILTGYVLFEAVCQGWRGWDTIEDTLFTAFYGAGGTLYTFTEIAPGSTEFRGGHRAPLAILLSGDCASVCWRGASFFHRQKFLKGMSQTEPGRPTTKYPVVTKGPTA